jgi:hypothetical protein
VVENVIFLTLTVMSLVGVIAALKRAWFGWAIFMSAQTASAIYNLAIGRWGWAVVDIALMWAFTWAWLHLMSARIVDDGILVEVDE